MHINWVIQKYLLSTFYTPSIGFRCSNEQNRIPSPHKKNPCPQEAYILVEVY